MWVAEGDESGVGFVEIQEFGELSRSVTERVVAAAWLFSDIHSKRPFE